MEKKTVLIASLCTGILIIAIIVFTQVKRYKTADNHDEPDKDLINSKNLMHSDTMAELEKLTDHDDSSIDRDITGEEFNRKIHSRTGLDLDMKNIAKESSEINKPYTTEEERQAVLKKLNDTKAMFENMISTTEKNIRQSQADNTRSEDEIDEAMSALDEMKKGRDFINTRIKMVENDKKK